MALALYRKYRPAKFAEVVGQEHVTEPLSRAIEAGRINHAYLFSGPRGCGKTSSARILARSLNCELGPTPEPCGVCSSCVSLAPGGPGNIDVTELDAASHGGVDDTRELRDRAFFAPAESRYRVFIVDEAHMITTQGFNALLKIVEEPPEHLVFVFATTEPEKVLPTIRSRTHHYPFRLIPPGTLRKLLERICAEEGVTVAAAVYPLVIRAGGGSARDSLSVLDQLVAGAGPEGVTYERAVALLGVTDVSLIDDVVDALAAGDRAAVFEAVDRLVEAGHDPRRFATDLLQRLRDLTLLQAVPEAVDHGLVEAADDEVSRMVEQSVKFGPATLTRYGEILHTGLTEMRGATAPRLLLELLCARMLLPAATTEEPGLLERLERLERRSAIAASPPAPGEAGAAAPAASGMPSSVGQVVTSSGAGHLAMSSGQGQADGGPVEPGQTSGDAAEPASGGPAEPGQTSGGPAEPGRASDGRAGGPRQAGAAPGSGAGAASGETSPVEGAPPDSRFDPPAAAAPSAPFVAPAAPRAPQAVEQPSAAPTREESAPQPVDGPEAAAVGAADVRRVWQEIQEAVKQRKKRTAALLVSATVRAVENDTLVLSIGTAPLARLLSEQSNTDVIAEALHAVLGVRWRVRCEHGDGPAPQAQERRQAARSGGRGPSREPQAPSGGYNGATGDQVPASGGAGGQVPGGYAPGASAAGGQVPGGYAPASGVASGQQPGGYAPGGGQVPGGYAPGGQAAGGQVTRGVVPGGGAAGGQVQGDHALSRGAVGGHASSGGAGGGQVFAGQSPGGGRASGGGAPSADAGGSSAREGGLRAGGARQQPARSVARATGRPTGRDDSVPLPPEPLDDETPPDDEEAMLAEFDAGPSEHAGPDPAEAAIALLTSQLGARAIDRR